MDRKKLNGYAELARYAGNTPGHWRNLNSDGRLPFPKHRCHTRRGGVFFWAHEVDAGMQAGEPGWKGAPLSLELLDLHTLAEEARDAAYEFTHERNAPSRIMEISRADAKRLEEVLSGVVGDLMIPLLLASIVKQGLNKKFLDKLRKGCEEEAWAMLASDWVFFKDGVMASLRGTTIYLETDEGVQSMEEIAASVKGKK